MPKFKFEGAKDWFWVFINSGLVVLIASGLFFVKALYRYGASLPPARTITVSAEGKTTAIPDIATVSFSVVTEGKNPEQVVVENTQKMNVAIAVVKQEGVPDKDIKTTSYNLSPRYEYDEDRRTSFISGYILTQTVTAKLRDFTKIGKILGLLSGTGVNQVNGPNFDIDNQDTYLNEARAEAFEKARAKAKAMAKQNQVRIKRVVTFSESSGGYPIPFFALSAESRGKDFGPAPAPAPSIEPGSQEVTVNVTVTYEIR